MEGVGKSRFLDRGDGLWRMGWREECSREVRTLGAELTADSGPGGGGKELEGLPPPVVD